MIATRTSRHAGQWVVTANAVSRSASRLPSAAILSRSIAAVPQGRRKALQRPRRSMPGRGPQKAYQEVCRTATESERQPRSLLPVERVFRRAQAEPDRNARHFECLAQPVDEVAGEAVGQGVELGAEHGEMR